LPILYRHIRQDKNEPFYIGIGESEDRAYETKGRTRAWKNISKKGYDIEVLFNDLSWEEACEKEKEFIALYGRRDKKTGTLVNMTDGGEGTVGYRHTVKTKETIKEKMTGSGNPNYGKKRPEHSNRMLGDNNPCFGRVGEKHPFFGKDGYWKGKTTSVAKKIVYEGIEFESQNKLAKYLNKSRSYITKLIKQNKL
jgi:hypothetical protein